MRISRKEIEGFPVNPEPDGDSWRCPYCDELKWGETTFFHDGQPVCSRLCKNSLEMRKEFEAQVEQGARDLEAAKLWNMLGWTLCCLMLMLLVISIDANRQWGDYLQFEQIMESPR